MAAAYVQKARTLAVQAKQWANYKQFGSTWEAHLEEMLGFYFRAKGQHKESEQAFRRAVVQARNSIKASATWEFPPLRSRLDYLVTYLIMNQGRSKALQGRAVEAEADIRQALLSAVRVNGKYATNVIDILAQLAYTLEDQSRFAEAETLIRTSIDLYREVGLPDSSNQIATLRMGLMGILNQQSRWGEASIVYEQLDKATQGWDKHRKEAFELNGSRIYMLYNTGRAADGLAIAKRFLERSQAQFGDKHFRTWLARGFYANGLRITGDTAGALAEFKKSVDFLLTVSFDSEDANSATANAAASTRIREVIKSYLDLLAQRAEISRGRSGQLPAGGGDTRQHRAEGARVGQRAHVRHQRRLWRSHGQG